MSAKVLVVGSGGREHALAWKLAQSTKVAQVIMAPGSDAVDCMRWSVDLSSGQAGFRELAEQAKSSEIDLVVIGPDNPLADGIVDVFSELGIPCFGPTKEAARIEASKAFAKEVMSAAGVPTARYKKFDSEREAILFLEKADWPPRGNGWVVKADGLALGKGVQVCKTLKDAKDAVQRLFPISNELVIEECLSGEEISWFALCDGENCALMEPARDYKRLRDGNEGPNTGGMGVFSPVTEVLTESYFHRMKTQVFEPVLREMKRRGTPFRGLLYAGLMVDLEKDLFWVLEFNARFGDPETQALLPRMDADLFQYLLAATHGKLNELASIIPFQKNSSVFVVAASPGYPERPEKEKLISGLSLQSLNIEQPELFLAGVKKGKTDGFVTSGGRVFGTLGIGSSLKKARNVAYELLGKVSFPGMQLRRDIAK